VSEYLKIAQELRDAGFNVEVYAGNEGTSLGKQLSYADKLVIPLAIIANPEELALGKIIIKNLTKTEQQVVKREELITVVKTFLS
jgi:histidyl-tRNA synthetase